MSKFKNELFLFGAALVAVLIVYTAIKNAPQTGPLFY